MIEPALNPIEPRGPLRPGPAPRAPGAASASEFARELRQAATGGPPRPGPREIAAEMVATAFVMPALESLRDGPFRGGLFAPGAAEKRFGPMLDREIATRLTDSPAFPLVDAVAGHIEAAAAKAGTPGGTA